MEIVLCQQKVVDMVLLLISDPSNRSEARQEERSGAVGSTKKGEKWVGGAVWICVIEVGFVNALSPKEGPVAIHDEDISWTIQFALVV